MTKNCKISIIIPSFNQAKYIERSFKSIEAQQDSNLEVIVMDGGSTDGSVDIIKKYAHLFSYWQSQKDNGQSSAINEGIRRSTGDFVVWFNTDDIMMPNAICNIRTSMKKYPECRWFAGSMLWIDTDDTIIHAGKQERMGKLLDSTFFISAGPSTFMRRDMLEEVGLLREDFHYIMDLELWYRLINNGNYMERVPGYTWAMRVHGDSKTMGRFSVDTEEYKRHERLLQEERERLSVMYPNQTLYQSSRWHRLSYYMNKIFDRSIFSHLLDKRLEGKKLYRVFH